MWSLCHLFPFAVVKLFTARSFPFYVLDFIMYFISVYSCHHKCISSEGSLSKPLVQSPHFTDEKIEPPMIELT